MLFFVRVITVELEYKTYIFARSCAVHERTRSPRSVLIGSGRKMLIYERLEA